jgi:DNA helicase-2/ATP-dependent DNA helicase PcrA
VIDLVNSLNPAQREAVTHLGSPLMIIAGAGTGKTRVITYRLAYLSREVGIPLNQILAVTFTNKAAKEMRERVCHILGVPDSPGLAIGTFHSRCALMLRREAPHAGLDPNFIILDEDDQRQAVRRVLKDMDITEKRVKPAMVQNFINQAKMRLLTPEETKEEFDDQEIPYPDIYARYQKILSDSKSIDFEDLMMKTVLLFQDNENVRQRWSQRYQYVMIDEYQDTNHAQFKLSSLLAKDHRQICVVGDEDQSIYSWRGAEITNLLDFEKSFPGTHIVKLEHNYRSTGNILKAASTVIAHNTQRIGKTLFTLEPEGEQVSFYLNQDQTEEARRIALECVRLTQASGVSPNDIAIFYRGHWLSRSVEDAMHQYRLPYRIIGGVRFYDRAEIKDLLCFLRLSVNPDDSLAFERVMNRPARGIGAKAQGQIEDYARANDLSYLRAAEALLNQNELKGTGRKGFEGFVSMIDYWVALAGTAQPAEVLEKILADTKYVEEGLGDTTSIEADSKRENIEEFKAMLADFKPTGSDKPLSEFLTSMALDSSEQKDDGRPRINLLTIHNAKGLEFPYVFLVGMEKGVFPTSRAEESNEAYAIEEERRLFYVAITRARKKLTLSYCGSRNRPDMWGTMQPSLFLSELPVEAVDEGGAKALRKLLPYNWGRTEAQGGSRDRELVYEPDESASPRAFAASRNLLAAGEGNLRRRSSGQPEFTTGTRVVHRMMGPGIVTGTSGRPGWERVHIQFDDGRTSEFILKYAPITLE